MHVTVIERKRIFKTKQGNTFHIKTLLIADSAYETITV